MTVAADDCCIHDTWGTRSWVSVLYGQRDARSHALHRKLSTERAHSLALCFYYYHPSTLNKSTCNPLTAKNMLNSVAVLSASHLSRKWREDLYNISEFISRHNTVMPRTRSYSELKLVLWQSTWMRTQPEATWARKQGSRLLYDDFNTFLYESLNVN